MSGIAGCLHAQRRVGRTRSGKLPTISPNVHAIASSFRFRPAGSCMAWGQSEASMLPLLGPGSLAPARASARPFTRLLSPVKGESDHPRPRSSRECRLAMRRKPMQLRPYKPVRAFWFVAVLVLVSCGLAQAQEFEGAWKLTMRKLPNGTTLMSPAVQGAIIAQAGLLTRVVFFHTPEGKLASFSGVSTYKMSPAEYTETLLFSALDDGSGKAPAYNQTPQTKSTPVTREGGRISFPVPVDPPSVGIEGDKMTATAEGMFVDYWERPR